MKPVQLQRYSAGQRANHWLVVTCFILAALSGFALFHPALFWFAALFGGPQWVRILHPYLGIATFLFFLGMFIRFARSNLWHREDTEWLASAGKMVSEGNEAQVPQKTGKYNGGQKIVFWLFTLSLTVLLATGLLFWQAWFASSVPIALQRVAVLLHAVAAVVLVLAFIVHVYAAIWVKGTLHAMVRGTVTAGWARHHHPRWFSEQMQAQGARRKQRSSKDAHSAG